MVVSVCVSLYVCLYVCLVVYACVCYWLPVRMAMWWFVRGCGSVCVLVRVLECV